MWIKKRRTMWTHSSGALIVKWNGLGFLLYKSYSDYTATAGDFKTFEKLSDAKNEADKTDNR